ncbi:glycosyltransferase [Thermohalobaculum sediminis]|uniref:glycosyltransferase n=1 Tax=Thermohalobaculum sediminis TaxID=2939436 RepID=UPI003872BF63
MNICIIGPVSPLWGDIARHTTALALELASRQGINVSIVSFSKRTPNSTYGAQSSGDLACTAPKGIRTSYCLDVANPFSWLRAARRALNDRPDLAIIPLCSFRAAPALGHVTRALRRRGIPVVTIVHNLDDLGAGAVRALLSAMQARPLTRFVTHTAALAVELGRRFPGIPAMIAPLPTHDHFPQPRGALPRRAYREILAFGSKHTPNGLDVLLRAIAGMRSTDIHLSIVGDLQWAREATDTLISELGITSRVEFVPRQLSSTEVTDHFERCDAVFTPEPSGGRIGNSHAEPQPSATGARMRSADPRTGGDPR